MTPKVGARGLGWAVRADGAGNLGYARGMDCADCGVGAGGAEASPYLWELGVVHEVGRHVSPVPEIGYADDARPVHVRMALLDFHVRGRFHIADRRSVRVVLVEPQANRDVVRVVLEANRDRPFGGEQAHRPPVVVREFRFLR
eukprot:1426550-Pyramimonas_sp.AAC.2